MGSLADTLSVAIGIVLIYLLLSVIASYLQELISSWLSLRSGFLANAIQLLLSPASESLNGLETLKNNWNAGKNIWDKGLTEEVKKDFGAYIRGKVNENPLVTFYSHPIIKTLSTPGKFPSYISSRDFSTTLFDIFLQAGGGTPTKPEEYLATLKNGVEKIQNEDLKRSIMPYLLAAENSEQEIEKKISAIRTNVEGWFNSTMDRASGWYKRRMQWIAIGLGLLIAFSFNADTIGITQVLWRDSALRQSISDTASAYIQKDNPQKADAAMQQLASINLPIGWSGRLSDNDPMTPNNPQDTPSLPNEIFLKFLGLVITGLAVSHGSSIWFDLLTKLVNLRNGGSKPADSPSEPPRSQRG